MFSRVCLFVSKTRPIWEYPRLAESAFGGDPEPGHARLPTLPRRALARKLIAGDTFCCFATDRSTTEAMRRRPRPASDPRLTSFSMKMTGREMPRHDVQLEPSIAGHRPLHWCRWLVSPRPPMAVEPDVIWSPAEPDHDLSTQPTRLRRGVAHVCFSHVLPRGCVVRRFRSRSSSCVQLSRSAASSLQWHRASTHSDPADRSSMPRRRSPALGPEPSTATYVIRPA